MLGPYARLQQLTHRGRERMLPRQKLTQDHVAVAEEAQPPVAASEALMRTLAEIISQPPAQPE